MQPASTIRFGGGRSVYFVTVKTEE